MKNLSILFSLLILSCFACNKEKINERTSVNCSYIEGAEILDENSLPCSYNEVYRFEGEIYTACVCCVCFKVALPINCDGQPLCTSDTDINECVKEFRKKAEYLYSIEELE